MATVTRCPKCNRYASPFGIVAMTPNLRCYIGRQSGLVISGVYYSFYICENEEYNYFRVRASLRCQSCGFEFDEVTEGPVALENLTVNHE